MKINSFVPDSKIFNTIGTTNNTVQNDGSQSDESSFMSILKNKLDQVNELQLDSENTTQQFISAGTNGGGPSIDEVMTAGEEAKMSLQLAVQVRNKLIDAYQELNKTQI